MQFELEDQQRIIAAQGFLELGMPLDANAEIEQLAPDLRHLPEVLAVRAGIYRALHKWELMQVVAQRLAQHEPNESQWTVWWAYATRRADSILAARRILAEAVERNECVAIFHYNLACYDCQLGDLDSAKAHLRRAFELRRDYRLKALDDDDLRLLWESL